MVSVVGRLAPGRAGGEPAATHHGTYPRTTIGFIAGRTPVALAEERYHWLSRRQREALSRAGLCLTISLDEFRHNPDVLINNLLQDPRLKDVQGRTYGIRIGAERDLARYLFYRYLEL